MQGAKNILYNAEQLARFANAESQEQMNSFREENRDFFPPRLWDRPTPKIEWKNAPAPDKPCFDPSPFEVEAYGSSGSLVLAGGRTTVNSARDLQRLVRQAWKSKFPLEWCILLLSFAQAMQDKLRFPPWPFQKAVMFLGVESWRVRFCSVCGSRHVADEPARWFCSIPCSQEARRNSRNAWWTEHGKGRRAKTLMIRKSQVKNSKRKTPSRIRPKLR